MTEFQEMTAIVTGGATGIGEATAQTLAKLGASVCIIDINDQGAEAVVSGINSSGGIAVKQIVDLTSWDATNAAVNSFAESNGRLDVVVHCAGGFPSYVSLNSNLRSMFYLLKAAAPLMVQRGYGRFVSLTSMAARSGVNPNPPHYTAAKGGMLALTRQAARDLGPHGITVNNVAPANVQTPRTKAIRSADRIAHIQKTTPVGRLSEPQEIADAIVFLASPRASYITGVTLDVNGGATMI